MQIVIEDGILHQHGGGEGPREHRHGALQEHLKQVLRVSPSFFLAVASPSSRAPLIISSLIVIVATRPESPLHCIQHCPICFFFHFEV
jgi:hypothetical protein